jgi:phosphate transport system substrate-binding protein
MRIRLLDSDAHRLSRGKRAAIGATALGSLLALSGSTIPAFASTSSTVDPYAKTDLHAPAGTLTGAGSTFDQPLFAAAFYDYAQKDPGVSVNYASIGSGGGIAQFQANTVNFGASDVPMSASDIAKAKDSNVLQVPVALGGVTVSYNVPGLKTGLNLTPSVLVGIFDGGITMWNAPQIKHLNPHAKLPAAPITTVHRSDGSGTTYIFTNYLSTVSSQWSTYPGVGKSVSWPSGSIGESGNAGVAGFIQNTPDSIGYVELAYALQNHFTYAAIQNKAGVFVSPSLQSVAAAAANKPQVTYLNFPIVNEPGKKSYPISGYSWALIYQKQSNVTTGTTLVGVLDWLTHAGQYDAKHLQYVPLPANIQALARKALLSVTGPDGTPLLKK